MVLGAAHYLVLVGVIGMALGGLLRNTAAGISALVALFFVIPPILDLLPQSWSNDIGPYLPSNAGESFWGHPDRNPPLRRGRGARPRPVGGRSRQRGRRPTEDPGRLRLTEVLGPTSRRARPVDFEPITHRIKDRMDVNRPRTPDRADTTSPRATAEWRTSLLAAGVLTADQVSKSLALRAATSEGHHGALTIRLVRNTGASLGIGAGHPLLITGIAVVLTALLAMFTLRTKAKSAAIGAAIALGGASRSRSAAEWTAFPITLLKEPAMQDKASRPGHRGQQGINAS